MAPAEHKTQMQHQALALVVEGRANSIDRILENKVRLIDCIIIRKHCCGQ
jgi:hypothetical protein